MAARVLDGPLFGAGGLLCLGFAVALLYAAVAVSTGTVPTISDVVSSTVLTHPVWSKFLYLLAGIIVGGLAVHFARWKP